MALLDSPFENRQITVVERDWRTFLGCVHVASAIVEPWPECLSPQRFAFSDASAFSFCVLAAFCAHACRVVSNRNSPSVARVLIVVLSRNLGPTGDRLAVFPHVFLPACFSPRGRFC